MEDRLKERLTGASLLVIVVVTLVPAMFRGDRPGSSAAAAPGSVTQQVYTIDLQGAPSAASAPSEPVAPADSEVMAPASSASSASSPSAAVPMAPAAAAPETGNTPEKAEISKPQIPKPPVPKPPIANPQAPRPQASKPEPAKAALAKAAAPKPVPPKAAPARPAAAKAATAAHVAGGYVVQVGSFTKRENALIVVNQAAKKGAKLQIAGPDQHGLFRVRSAVVHSHQEAMTLAERLKGQGFKGVVSAAD